MTGKIINIQKCSIHNGPGIRTTVFFKGCPMSCLWCHNPESQNFKTEVMHDNNKCSLCKTCIEVCENKCIQYDKGSIKTFVENCSYCETCMDFCINGSRELVGKDISPKDLVKELLKDKEFFKNSNGGVTLSGGEALSQDKFAIEVARLLSDYGISVALDTCGFINTASLVEISKYIDIFLFDIKVIDPNNHKKFTGVDNQLIFHNLNTLNELGARIFIRIPLIDGINTSPTEIEGMINLIDGMNIEKISLLPYHEIGQYKYNKLKLKYKENLMKTPSNEKIEEIKKLFEKKYFVEIGG